MRLTRIMPSPGTDQTSSTEGGVVVHRFGHLLVPPPVVHAAQLGPGPDSESHEIARVGRHARATGDGAAEEPVAELGAVGEPARAEHHTPVGADRTAGRAVVDHRTTHDPVLHDEVDDPVLEADRAPPPGAEGHQLSHELGAVAGTAVGGHALQPPAPHRLVLLEFVVVGEALAVPHAPRRLHAHGTDRGQAGHHLGPAVVVRLELEVVGRIQPEERGLPA